MSSPTSLTVRQTELRVTIDSVAARSGFFELTGPVDLVFKMEHDLRRLRKNPADVFAAFDFFVTAVHLPEWITRCDLEWVKPVCGPEAAIMCVCAQLGNGAKHLVIHQKLKGGTEIRYCDFDPVSIDPDGRAGGELVIHLNAAESDVLGRQTLTALEAAEMVMAYWDKNLIEHSRLKA